MEKLGELDTDSQSVEDWLEIFEARADCLGIHQTDRKIKWCKSVIGGVGRKILKNLPPRASWEDATQELRRFLGEEDSQSVAWRKLRRYRAEGKPFGEIASDVLGLASMAAGEVHVRQKLAVDAFLEAMPWKYSIELKKKRVESVEEALQEVKLLKLLEEEEKEHQNRTMVQQEVRQASSKEGHQAGSRESAGNTRLNSNRREVTCWACGKRGHIMKNCYVWDEFKRKRTRTTESTNNATAADDSTNAQLN